MAKIVTIEDHEFKEVIEEYEEKVLVQEEVPEPSLTDLADTPPAQGKPRCITLTLNDHWIYIYVMCIYVTGFILKLHA